MPADQAADLFIAGIAYAARAANMADAAAVLRLPLDASAPEGAKPLAETIAATKAAVDATKAIDGKLAGAPPAEITALLALADAARIAAVQEPVPTARKAAFEAAANLASTIDAALADATMRFETHRIRVSTDGKEALGHLAAADATSARADAILLPGSEAVVLGGAAADIKAASDTATEISVYRLETDLDTRASALAEAEANAKNGGAAVAPHQIRDEIDALKLAAETAAQEARLAMDALTAATPSDDPAGFIALIKTAADKRKAALEPTKNVVDDAIRDIVLDQAVACLAAVDAASKRPAFNVMRAAQAAKTDLDMAGPVARNAAITASEADTLSNSDADVLEAAARDITARIEPDDIDGQIARADTAAKGATALAEDARSALSRTAPSTDSPAYANAVKLLSDRAEPLVRAAPQALDATTRDAAIATATACAKQAAAATNPLAVHHQTAATKAAFDKQNADLRDTGGPRNAYGEARNALTQPTTSAAINTKASQLDTQAQGKRTDPNQTGLSATARTKTLDAA